VNYEMKKIYERVRFFEWIGWQYLQHLESYCTGCHLKTNKLYGAHVCCCCCCCLLFIVLIILHVTTIQRCPYTAIPVSASRSSTPPKSNQLLLVIYPTLPKNHQISSTILSYHSDRQTDIHTKANT